MRLRLFNWTMFIHRNGAPLCHWSEIDVRKKNLKINYFGHRIGEALHMWLVECPGCGRSPTIRENGKVWRHNKYSFTQPDAFQRGQMRLILQRARSHDIRELTRNRV